ncbi:putative molecular chaperone HspA/DnaK domain protein [Burkholderia pseudomallei MSHR640]|nr:putative molecular chaperone HspA/DnaK domain protein [Burkholderia pseudomallei MSHR640]
MNRFIGYAFAPPRTSNSTFQRSCVPPCTASSSSVPASVTRACSLTGTTSPGVPARGRQRRLDRVELLQLVGRPEVEQRADLVLPAHRRTEEAEADGLADDEAELLRRQRGVGAFLHPERRDAQRLDRRLEAGHGRHRRFDRDVIRARRAAANAHAAAALHVAVVGRAARDREIEIGAAEQTRGRRALGREPAVERVEHALDEQRRLEHAAVEEHRARMQEARRRVMRVPQPVELRERSGLPAEERGEMARDAGVLRVRQAELHEARARAAHRPRRRVDGGEEAFEDRLRQLGARELGADRAADQLRAAARHDERHGLRRRIAEQRLLRAAARVGERAQLPGVGLRALRGELARDHVREREIHVVAAEQDMLADRDAMQLEVAVALDDRDQRQVGRAAADVDDEDDVADPDVLAPRAAAFLDPAVERRLRLLEQRHMRVAGRLRGLGRQLARGRIERRGNRDGDVLPIERRVRMRVVPRLAQMGQIAHRRVERRHARDFRRRVARQDAGAAIDARMAQPALRARHEADRRARAAAARELADREVALGRPRQRELARRELARMRQIEKRRQQIRRVDCARRGELRDRQHAKARLLAVARREIHVRQPAVGGAQIDADRITRVAHSATSAGAMIDASWPGFSFGSRTASTRQPRWLMLP